MKFGIVNFHKISQENPNLFAIKQKYLELYVNTYIDFTVNCNIKSP